MIRKIIDITVALIFILFAGLQLNDPDGWLWVLIYAFVVTIAILNLFGSLTRSRTFKTLIVFAILLVVYSSNLIAWVRGGFPNIVIFTNETKEVVEGIREYFGLMISFAVILFYDISALKSSKKNKNKPPE